MRGLATNFSKSDKAATFQKTNMKKGSKTDKSDVLRKEGLMAERGGSGGEKYVHCALLGDGMVGKTCLTLSYTQQAFTDRYTATVFDNYPVPVSVGGEQFTLSLFDTAGQKDYESLRAYTYESSEVLVLCFSVCDRESFYNVVNCWLPEIQRHVKGKRPLLLVGTQVDLRTTTTPTTNSSPLSSDLSTASYADLRTSPPSSSSSFKPPDRFSYAEFSTSEFTCSSPSSSTPSSLALSSNPRDSLSSVSSSLSDSSGSSNPCQDEVVSTEEGSQLARVIGADCYIECSARTQEGVRQVFEHVVCSALKYRKKKKSRFLGKFFREKPLLTDKDLQRAASTLNIPVSSLDETR